MNNLNDGVAWGLFPLLFAAASLSPTQITLLVAIYPAVWGSAQLLTGGRVGPVWTQTADRQRYDYAGRRTCGRGRRASFSAWLWASVLLGLGTALVYPTLLAAVSDVAHPSWRSSAIGIYRLWRDSGYVAGALLAGVCADLFGIRAAVLAVAAVTFVSGAAVALRMPETAQRGVTALAGSRWRGRRHFPGVS